MKRITGIIVLSVALAYSTVAVAQYDSVQQSREMMQQQMRQLEDQSRQQRSHQLMQRMQQEEQQQIMRQMLQEQQIQNNHNNSRSLRMPGLGLPGF